MNRVWKKVAVCMGKWSDIYLSVGITNTSRYMSSLQKLCFLHGVHTLCRKHNFKVLLRVTRLSGLTVEVSPHSWCYATNSQSKFLQRFQTMDMGLEKWIPNKHGILHVRTNVTRIIIVLSECIMLYNGKNGDTWLQLVF